jgi:hypothetical protein
MQPRLTALCAFLVLIFSPASSHGDAVPAKPRKMVSEEFVTSDPVFAKSSETLDLLEIARFYWKGNLSQAGDYEEVPPGEVSQFRLYFGIQATPWPAVGKHPDIDRFDVCVRNIGAHAYLHEMLGDEKKNDAIEKAQLEFTFADGAQKMISAESCKNTMLHFQRTGSATHKELNLELKKYMKPSYNHPDTFGGWISLHVGWTLFPHVQWYQQYGDRDALEMAVKCFDRTTTSIDEFQNGGEFRQDVSFGGKDPNTSPSWHMHSHTHDLTGMVMLGRELIKDGRKEKGLRVITQANNTFDGLFDPERNPDAGSLTGWLAEWLMVATG